MSDNWYGQKSAGFWQAGPEDVSLLARKLRTKNERKDTQLYTETVVRRIEQIRGAGYKGWIAPECHNDDPSAKEQWVWRFPNKDHLMEAKYVEGVSLEELHFVCALHKGMGWRFPKLMVFDKRPGEEALNIMKAGKVPWCIESEMRGEAPPPPRFNLQDLYEQQVVAEEEVAKLGDMIVALMEKP